MFNSTLPYTVFLGFANNWQSTSGSSYFFPDVYHIPNYFNYSFLKCQDLMLGSQLPRPTLQTKCPITWMILIFWDSIWIMSCSGAMISADSTPSWPCTWIKQVQNNNLIAILLIIKRCWIQQSRELPQVSLQQQHRQPQQSLVPIILSIKLFI